jgi:predicted transglutaminase-like cysteine proteinase
MVNARVNHEVRPQSDLAHYGVEDYWDMPFENGSKTGDCEDYALEKRKLLISAGLPMNALSVALVRTAWKESHAVLLVHTNNGDYVLDNLSPFVEPWMAVRYTWLKWQSRGNPNVWVEPAAN